MNDSITISEEARAYIMHIRSVRQEGEGLGFYLGIKKSGCNGWLYAPDIIDQADDTMRGIDCAGLLIYVPSEHWSLLVGTHIDLSVKDLGQKVLIYDNPNAASECGCGESFSIQAGESS